ncbi:serine protease [Corynebacterium mastitidis]|uniref:trypsin-like serine peptidase n=1 Tax=Corynebacterium mastitidis TaxID=161890 RepID=UPI0012FECBFB|nr:trypsin-like peptidase domain-containing protein [Corynebacterium mastitidis]MCH6196734.1 serine protease [Corynebacterium mastitidis]
MIILSGGEFSADAKDERKGFPGVFSSDSFRCTAFAISSNLVVTSSHCIKGGDVFTFSLQGRDYPLDNMRIINGGGDVSFFDVDQGVIPDRHVYDVELNDLREGELVEREGSVSYSNGNILSLKDSLFLTSGVGVFGDSGSPVLNSSGKVIGVYSGVVDDNISVVYYLK